MKIMFLDESGDHSLTKIDPQYPMFVLGGIIVDSDYVESELEPRLRRFKQELFGRDDLILHTADIYRNRNGFEQLKEPRFRERFYTALNHLMRNLDYKVVACAIKKDAHLARYGAAAYDPYHWSLNILVERYCFELNNDPEGGIIIAEQRGRTFDLELRQTWESILAEGTDYIDGTRISSQIRALDLRNKKENLAGLQLADLVVSPIGRHVLGKKGHEDWVIIESKFRRSQGTYRGSGLVVLPKV